MASSKETLIGVGQAAKILGCSRQYVFALVQTGRLKASKFLGRWLISETALEGITLKGHKTSPGRKPGKKDNGQNETEKAIEKALKALFKPERPKPKKPKKIKAAGERPGALKPEAI